MGRRPDQLISLQRDGFGYAIQRQIAGNIQFSPSFFTLVEVNVACGYFAVLGNLHCEDVYRVRRD